MILGGMGPVGDLPTDAAKLFASFYALVQRAGFHLGDGHRPSACRSPRLASFPSRRTRPRPIMNTKHERVVILGASDNPERYSHRALLLLKQHGHEVVPVHPKLVVIEETPVVADLSADQGPGGHGDNVCRCGDFDWLEGQTHRVEP
jgi:hypothetical protein